jgi:glyoxylase-like metal-dependent hydrolase (beta-lactamase superfamily II)
MPEAYAGDTLELEGHRIAIRRLGAGESAAAAALYIPELKALIAGDLAFNHVHLWLAGGEFSGWLRDLHDFAKPKDVERVYPGHGEPGGKELLAETDRYIRMFAMVTDRSAAPDVALNELQTLYPHHRVPFYLQRAVQARFEKKAEKPKQ